MIRMNRRNRVSRTDRNGTGNRSRRGLWLPTAIASAVVAAGGVMLPAVTASAAPMPETPPVSLTAAHHHDHHDRDRDRDDHRRHHCDDHHRDHWDDRHHFDPWDDAD
ncbi:hypothetical protein ACWEN3_45340 [Streptomyces sp. NPDC004561]